MKQLSAKQLYQQYVSGKLPLSQKQLEKLYDKKERLSAMLSEIEECITMAHENLAAYEAICGIINGLREDFEPKNKK